MVVVILCRHFGLVGAVDCCHCMVVFFVVVTDIVILFSSCNGRRMDVFVHPKIGAGCLAPSGGQ